MYYLPLKFLFAAPRKPGSILIPSYIRLAFYLIEKLNELYYVVLVHFQADSWYE